MLAAAVPETHILVVDDPEYLEEALSDVYEVRGARGREGGREGGPTSWWWMTQSTWRRHSAMCTNYEVRGCVGGRLESGGLGVGC